MIDHPDLTRNGFLVLPGIYSADDCSGFIERLTTALESRRDDAGTLQRASGVIYGARNLLDAFPPARDVWRRQPLVDLLTAALGPRFGLVRGLYFDKPPQSTWSLPWHQDRTIAVIDNTIRSPRFKSPTKKAGVPHIEAPDEVLQQMLTLRIHLDDATDENGPLVVLPGSHVGQVSNLSRTTAPPDQQRQAGRLPHVIHAAAGDVLLMRPLLYHCSGSSNPCTTRHRRILHLEFAASPELPDGFRWHKFSPAD
ncbi:MAG TPA: phytanoyl-CoA dioxygenase family protein [Pirellulaceae bacterium]|nr:phytanoyl-CoA dioxygenase family protein [Pirellulaceae bacterium]